MMTKNSQHKNILMVSDDFLPAATGVGIHIQTICLELVKQGHHVIVLTSRQGNQLQSELWNGVVVERCNSIKVAGFYQAIPNTTRIRKIIKDHNIQIVHFHYLSALMAATSFLIRKLNLKSLYTYHMTEDHITQPWFMRPFRGLIRKLIVRYCNSMDSVISPSNRLKHSIIKKGIRVPVNYITNPISNQYFQNEIKTESNNSTFNVLFVGRLNLEKNITLLIKSFAEHLLVFPNSRLSIIGRGDQELNLKKLCQNLGISKSVDFLGFKNPEQLTDHYKKCDVFVLPSLVETQGMVAMEAMSFSKPIIVTNAIISAEELVESGVNGFIVDAYNPEELSLRLNQLALSPNLRIKLGEGGLRKISNYHPQTVTNQLVDIYNEDLNHLSP